MSRVLYHPAAPYNLSPMKRWVPSLGIWGVGIGTAALFVLSVTPKIKRTILVNVPVLGSYYEDKTPASDKPF